MLVTVWLQSEVKVPQRDWPMKMLLLIATSVHHAYQANLSPMCWSGLRRALWYWANGDGCWVHSDQKRAEVNMRSQTRIVWSACSQAAAQWNNLVKQAEAKPLAMLGSTLDMPDTESFWCRAYNSVFLFVLSPVTALIQAAAHIGLLTILLIDLLLCSKRFVHFCKYVSQTQLWGFHPFLSRGLLFNWRIHFPALLAVRHGHGMRFYPGRCAKNGWGQILVYGLEKEEQCSLLPLSGIPTAGCCPIGTGLLILRSLSERNKLSYCSRHSYDGLCCRLYSRALCSQVFIGSPLLKVKSSLRRAFMVL